MPLAALLLALSLSGCTIFGFVGMLRGEGKPEAQEELSGAERAQPGGLGSIAYRDLQLGETPEAVRCKPVWLDLPLHPTSHVVGSYLVDEDTQVTVTAYENDLGGAFDEYSYRNFTSGEMRDEFYHGERLILRGNPWQLGAASRENFYARWAGGDGLLIRSTEDDRGFLVYRADSGTVFAVRDGQLTEMAVPEEGLDPGVLWPFWEGEGPAATFLGYNGETGQLLAFVELEGGTALVEYNTFRPDQPVVLLEGLPRQDGGYRSGDLWGTGDGLTRFEVKVEEAGEESGMLYEYDSGSGQLHPVLCYDSGRYSLSFYREGIMIHDSQDFQGSILYHHSDTIYKLEPGQYATNQQIGEDRVEGFLTYDTEEENHYFWDFTDNRRYYITFEDIQEGLPEATDLVYYHGVGSFYDNGNDKAYAIDWYTVIQEIKSGGASGGGTSGEAAELLARGVPDPINPAYYIPHYDALRRLHEDFYVVAPFREDGLAYASIRGNRWYGFVDTSGEVAIPFLYRDVPMSFYLGNLEFREGLAGFYQFGEENLFGYLDRDGEVAISPQYRQGNRFSGGIAPVQLADGSYRYIDASGNPVGEYPPCIWALRQADYAEEGLYPIQDGELCGFMDVYGEIAVPPAYQAVQPFSEGLAAVQGEDGLWGYINAAGEMVIPPQFRSARGFSEGLAAVAAGDAPGELESLRYSYIDREGNLVMDQAANIPIMPGSAEPQPSALDCKNGIVTGSAYSINLTDELFNSRGEPLDIGRDCPAELWAHEKAYVGEWEVTYPVQSAYASDEPNARLRLYEDRTAVLVDPDGEVLLNYGQWVARDTTGYAVFLQTHEGEYLSFPFLPVEQRLYGGDRDPLPEATSAHITGLWTTRKNGGGEAARYWFREDGSFVYARAGAESEDSGERLVYTAGSWRMEGENLFLSAHSALVLEGGTQAGSSISGGQYAYNEIPEGERIVEEYEVILVQWPDRDGVNSLVLAGEDHLWSSGGSTGDMEAFQGNTADFQQSLTERNALRK